jgi:hypothetical protein
MKTNTYYIVSLALLILIVTICIYYGCVCQYTKEGFETESKKELNDFHKKILEDVTSGKIDNVEITKYIKDGKVSKEDLDIIINHLVNQEGLK